jgi:hypothetical protein
MTGRFPRPIHPRSPIPAPWDVAGQEAIARRERLARPFEGLTNPRIGDGGINSAELGYSFEAELSGINNFWRQVFIVDQVPEAGADPLVRPYNPPTTDANQLSEPREFYDAVMLDGERVRVFDDEGRIVTQRSGDPAWLRGKNVGGIDPRDAARLDRQLARAQQEYPRHEARIRQAKREGPRSAYEAALNQAYACPHMRLLAAATVNRERYGRKLVPGRVRRTRDQIDLGRCKRLPRYLISIPDNDGSRVYAVAFSEAEEATHELINMFLDVTMDCAGDTELGGVDDAVMLCAAAIEEGWLFVAKLSMKEWIHKVPVSELQRILGLTRQGMNAFGEWGGRAEDYASFRVVRSYGYPSIVADMARAAVGDPGQRVFVGSRLAKPVFRAFMALASNARSYGGFILPVGDGDTVFLSDEDTLEDFCDFLEDQLPLTNSFSVLGEVRPGVRGEGFNSVRRRRWRRYRSTLPPWRVNCWQTSAGANVGPYHVRGQLCQIWITPSEEYFRRLRAKVTEALVRGGVEPARATLDQQLSCLAMWQGREAFRSEVEGLIASAATRPAPTRFEFISSGMTAVFEQLRQHEHSQDAAFMEAQERFFGIMPSDYHRFGTMDDE